MHLKLITPPTLEPVTLQEAQIAARLLADEFTNIIPGLIKAGREAAENFQNVAYLTQTWEQIYDTFPAMPVEIERAPLQSLESVMLYDENGQSVSMDKNDFIVSTRSNQIGFKKGKQWPSITLQGFDSVIFTFKAGYTDTNKVPESIKLAIKLFVNYFLDNPDAVLEKPPQQFYTLLWPERRVPV